METLEHFFTYLYCLHEYSIFLDPLEEEQQFTEDCEACCRPILFTLVYNGTQMKYFEAVAELD